jgi:transposase
MVYYSISEVSKQLNVSKVTIYKKINKINELKQHVKQLKDGICIAEEGIEVIKKSLQENQAMKHLQPELKGEPTSEETTVELTVYKQLIEIMEKQVLELKEDRQRLYEQLGIKDKQLESLTDALSTAQRLNENSQVLLRQEQEKNQLLLEAAQAPQEAPKGGFFSRVFRKETL